MIDLQNDQDYIKHQSVLAKYSNYPRGAAKGETIYESFQNAIKAFKDRPCFGVRERTIQPNGKVQLGDFQWITYEEFDRRSNIVGNGLRQYIDSRSFFTICANNCLEWYLTDYACIWHGIRVVPMHHQASKDNIDEMVNNSESRGIMIAGNSVDKVIDLIHQNKLPSLNLIVILSNHLSPEPPSKELIESVPSHIKVVTFEDLVKLGQSVEPVPHNPFRSDELFGLMYTSGSTGSPKGIMLMDNLYNEGISKGVIKPQPFVYLSFLTMSHIQRKFDHSCFYFGGLIGIFSGSMETIFDDIQTLNPTTFYSISRFYNLVYEQYLFLKQMNQEDKIKNILGNRIQLLATFGSLTNQGIKDFVAEVWPGIPFFDFYGQNEDTDFGLSVNGYFKDGLEFRLESVPELGYYITDKPYPRGELIMKRKSYSPGYYKREDLTKLSFIDGWYHTQDIVEQIGPNRISVIDRKKNVFKLLNGEFVAPENLESDLAVSKLVESVIIYGDIRRSFLVAIVVPSYDMKEQYPKERESELKTLIHEDFKRIAKEKSLSNYEVPRAIALDYETVWSFDNGLMTQSGKICRRNLEIHYKKSFETMYQEDATSNLSGFIKSILNIEEDEKLGSLSFSQLGGDSLSAIKLTHMIKEKINIELPTSIILNIDNNISRLSLLLKEYIENNRELKNEDINWDEEIQLQPDIQPGNKAIKPLKPKINVFLTGSTGYLGSFILYQLLSDERVDKVYCLIRNSAGVKPVDILTNLNTKFRLDLEINKENISRIIVVPGDLSLKQFGLSDSEFLNLANQVDLLIHNGALVNMSIPYNNTRASNVNSTREMIKLSCVGDNLIPLSHISSVGVFRLDYRVDEDNKDHSDFITEETIPSLNNLPHLNGYRQSKLVAEQIINEAYKRGFPIIMHRPSTIYADSRTGVDNQNDLVGLIIKGLLYMKSYPNTAMGELNSYNLVPVDWVSKSITQLSLNQQLFARGSDKKLSIYHMINETNTSIQLIGQIIKESKLVEGEMKEISIEQWKQELEQCDQSNPLYLMKSLVSSASDDQGGYSYNVQFKTPFTTTSLQSLNLETCKPISTSNIIKNIKYLLESSSQQQ